MPNPEDPRLGLASASSFERTVECPGSNQLINSLPKGPEPPNEFAERGTRIHRAFATGDPSELDEDDTTLYNQGVQYEKEIVAKWRSDYNLPDPVVIAKEERFFLHDPDTLDPIASGQPDKIYHAEDRLLGIDYKCLWSPHLPPAPRSWQLRLYAVLIWRNLDGWPNISSIRFAHCKPMRRDGASDWTDYRPEDLAQSEASIRYHLWLSTQAGASRHAGQWCQYCKAKTACPEAAAMSLLPSVIAQRALPTSAEVEDMVAAMTNEDLLKLWQIDSITRKILDAVDARLKMLPAAELNRLGLELPERGRAIDEIRDVKGAFAFLRDTQSLPEEKLWLALKLTKGGVSQILQQERGMRKAWADKLATEILSPYADRKYAAATLKEIKGI